VVDLLFVISELFLLSLTVERVECNGPGCQCGIFFFLQCVFISQYTSNVDFISMGEAQMAAKEGQPQTGGMHDPLLL